jgi:hypothetical protein
VVVITKMRLRKLLIMGSRVRVPPRSPMKSAITYIL